MSTAKRYHSQPQNSRMPRRARVSTVVMAALIVAMLVAFGQLAQGLWSTRWAPLARDPLSNFPHIILWAWERPEMLDFIDPDAVGVAFLAGTLSLIDAQVSLRGRAQTEIPRQSAPVHFSPTILATGGRAARSYRRGLPYGAWRPQLGYGIRTAKPVVSG